VKIRRIVVGLDSAPCGRMVLEPAAAAAAKLEAELVGLFVENMNLLNFAGFPFAREVGFQSAMRRPLDVAAMERSLRIAATAAREMLAAVAGGTALRWSFRVTRGVLPAELLAAADEADLVVAGPQLPADLVRPDVRVVRAEDPRALHAALREDAGGVLVLAGEEALVGAALRSLLDAERT
jgi:hypothetical protein